MKKLSSEAQRGFLNKHGKICVNIKKYLPEEEYNHAILFHSLILTTHLSQAFFVNNPLISQWKSTELVHSKCLSQSILLKLTLKRKLSA